MAKNLSIKLVPALQASKKDGTATVKALGLRSRRYRPGSDNLSIRGMIFKVKHLVEVGERLEVIMQLMIFAPQ